MTASLKKLLPLMLIAGFGLTACGGDMDDLDQYINEFRLTRQLPEGVYLTGMRQNGVAVELMGIAQSSTRVSALMRQVDSSDWLTDPGVIKVETTETGPSRQAEFVVNLKQISHDDAGLEDEQ